VTDLVSAIYRSSLTAFAERAMTELEPGTKLRTNWHHEAIAKRLNDTVSGVIRRLIVNQPPKTLKTHLISECFVAWELGSNPETKFAIVCYDEALATRIVRQIPQIMRSTWYRAMYPDAHISGDKDSEGYFETTFGGEVRAVSIQGGITGYGYDFIIIDDPMKASVAHSETERRRLEELYASAIANRWRDPTKGVLIVVMQRLHVDDFSAFLLRARPDTVHLKIPAVAPCDVEYEIGDGKRHIFRKGELLEPDRLTDGVLQEMRALQGLAHYNAQYLQDPILTGGQIIESSWLRRFDIPRKHDYRVISVDPAFTENGGDHSAAIVYNLVGEDIEIIHAERVQRAFTGLVQWVGSLDGTVRLNSILPVCAPGHGGAPLFLLMNCHRARQVLRPKMAYTYLP
jgi:hypothetical protein